MPPCNAVILSSVLLKFSLINFSKNYARKQKLSKHGAENVFEGRDTKISLVKFSFICCKFILLPHMWRINLCVCLFVCLCVCVRVTGSRCSTDAAVVR